MEIIGRIKTLLYYLLGIKSINLYMYGYIQGFTVKCRKHKVTGIVEVKYRNKEDYSYSIDAYSSVKDYYKHKFIPFC